MSKLKNFGTLLVLIVLSITCINDITAEEVIYHCPYEAISDPALQIQDLRGIECYAQPDQLVVCGPGDTIPILLFTKSEDPIYDAFLNVEFGEGLEFADFAYVASGNADLDTINVDNPESPTFRISEVSQETEAVVVYIGVTGVCGVDYSVYEQSITYNLTYTSNGVQCIDEFTPEIAYGGNVLEPVAVFAGPHSDQDVTVACAGEETCTTIDATNLTSGAPVIEALFTVDDYGFDLGLEVSSISVNGIDMSFMPDDSGRIEVLIDGNANPALWGGDGILTSTESIPIEVCYLSDVKCFDFDVDPVHSLVFTCDGEVCGGTTDVATHRFRDLYTGGPSEGTMTFDTIQSASFCDPILGGPKPAIVEVSFTSNGTDPVKGEIWNLNYRLDTCTSNYLVLDSAYFVDGPMGAYVAAIPDSNGVQNQNVSGFLYIDFRDLEPGLDVDGPGGLEDLDGDGVYDDLPAGETIYFRMELLPSCEAEALSCSDDGGQCDFTRHQFNWLYNCGRNGRTIDASIDPGFFAPPVANSTASFSDPDMFTDSGVDFEGYNFGTFGFNNTMPTSSTKNIEFNYTLSPGDFTSCPTTGNYSIQFQITGRNIELADMEFSNIVDPNGATPGMFDINEFDMLNIRTMILDLGASIPATGNFTFDITLDTAICAAAEELLVQAFILQECDGCDCTLSAVCGTTWLYADPAFSGGCNTGSSGVEICRVTAGYTDRSLGTKVDLTTVSADDKKKVVPGDTIRVIGYVSLDNQADYVNTFDRYIDFSFRYVTKGGSGGNAVSPLKLLRPDMNNARLQDFYLKRQDGSIFDLGNINIPGDYLAADASMEGGFAGSGGAYIGEPWTIGYAGSEQEDPCVSHPAISPGMNIYQSPMFNNSGNDYGDGNFSTVRFLDPCPNSEALVQQHALTALINHIGGGFEDMDTVFMEWEVPIICTPEFLADGSLSIDPTLAELTGNFEFNFAATEWSATCGAENSASSSPRRQDELTMVKPDITLDTRIDYVDDCTAELVHKLIVEDTTGTTCFVDEFRPFVGFEDITFEIPMPYYFDTIWIEHFDQDPIPIIPDSSMGVTQVEYNGAQYFIPSGVNNTITLVDAEKLDGLRANNYIGWDCGDNDVTLVGGTFPLAGVGLLADGTAFDSLVFRIPLTRICGTNLMDGGDGITVTSNVSANYITDFDRGGLGTGGVGWYCNNGAWYGGIECPPGVDFDYWPYDREDDGNPAHYYNDEVTTATPVGVPPTLLSATLSTDQPEPIADLGGPETTIVTFNTTNPSINGGYLSICVENAVEIISIGGAAPIEVGSTDSSKIYYYDLTAFGSPLPTGPLDVVIEHDLSYCAPAEVVVKASLGCEDGNPPGYDAEEAAAILALSGKECDGVMPVSFEYQAGQPAAELDFTINNNLALCATSLQTILISNTGTSPLADFFPTIYLPEGYEFVAGTWDTLIIGGSMGDIGDPTENTTKTGVYGTAYEWPLGTFADLAEGETLELSFMGKTTCDMVMGSPITVELSASAACGVDFMIPPTSSEGITVQGLSDNPPMFTIESDEYEINCAGATEVVVTAVNTGKSLSSESTLCITTPPGVVLDADAIEWLAPVGYTDTELVGPTAVGTGGAQRYELVAPQAEPGGFFCVKVVFSADLECGPIDIGFDVKRTETLSCSDPAMDCDVSVSSGEDVFLEFEVVPGAFVAEAEVVASCHEDADSLYLDYTFLLENPSEMVFSGDVKARIYYDINNNGSLEPEGDILLDTLVEPILLAGGATMELVGQTSVHESQSCALIVMIEAPGCVCSEIIIPVDEVLPDFIAELGTDIVLCPGLPYQINDICGDVTWELIPEEAGEVTMIGDGIEISLNDGFGVENPVQLSYEVSIGNCLGQSDTINISQLESFEFGPHNFTVCDSGCTQLDLGIDINLLEDIEISISPGDFLDDPTSAEPITCNPTSETIYEITYSLNGGQCVFETVMLVDITEQPTIEVTPVTGCTGGFDLTGLITVSPVTLDGDWMTEGDGTFEGGTRFSTATKYIPGPIDLAAGEVTLVVRTDTPVEACGGAVARESFKVLLVDCGAGKWDGK